MLLLFFLLHASAQCSEAPCAPPLGLQPAFTAANIPSDCRFSLATCAIPQQNQALRSRQLQLQAMESCAKIQKLRNEIGAQKNAQQRALELQNLAIAETQSMLTSLKQSFEATQQDMIPVLQSLVDGPMKEAYRAAMISPETARVSGMTGAATLEDPRVNGSDVLFAAQNGAGFLRILGLEIEQRKSVLEELGKNGAIVGEDLTRLKQLTDWSRQQANPQEADYGKGDDQNHSSISGEIDKRSDTSYSFEQRLTEPKPQAPDSPPKSGLGSVFHGTKEAADAIAPAYTSLK